jgi:hypothetical protein
MRYQRWMKIASSSKSVPIALFRSLTLMYPLEDTTKFIAIRPLLLNLIMYYQPSSRIQVVENLSQCTVIKQAKTV